MSTDDKEAQPMDPERLAKLELEASLMCKNLIPGSVLHVGLLIRELLADRDHWESRSVTLSANHLTMFENMERISDALEAEVAEALHYRSRCPVEASDVEAAGVTWAHVTAWLSSQGWTRRPGHGIAHDAGGSFEHWALGLRKWDTVVVCVYEHEYKDGIARTLGIIARHVKRVGLDILDEMAKEAA